MAVDTRVKRQSVVGVSRPFCRAHFAGTISQPWRVGIGNGYAGISYTKLSDFTNFNTSFIRQNVLKVGRPFMRSHFAGLKSEFWRMSVGNVYASNSLIATNEFLGFNNRVKRQNVLTTMRPFMRSHFAGDKNIPWRASIGNAYGANIVQFIFTAAPKWVNYQTNYWENHSEKRDWVALGAKTKWS